MTIQGRLPTFVRIQYLRDLRPEHHNRSVQAVAVAQALLFQHLLDHAFRQDLLKRQGDTVLKLLLENFGSIRHSRGSLFGLQGSDSLISSLGAFFVLLISVTFPHEPTLTMLFAVPLHKLIILFMIALAANLDNLGIGTAYGLANRRISQGSNLIIALLAISLTYVSMAFGRVLVLLLPGWVANLVGALLIVLVGCWLYWEVSLMRLRHQFYSRLFRHWRSLVQRPTVKTAPASTMTRQPVQSHTLPISRQRVDLKETFVLGVSLALNAMAGGLGASLSGHNPFITSVAVGVFSYITLEIGQAIAGSYLSKRLGSLAPKAAGLVLIAIGIYELFD